MDVEDLIHALAGDHLGDSHIHVSNDQFAVGDRESLESRRIMETIDTAAARDALRIHMSLHLAGFADSSVVAGGILDRCLLRR